MFIFRGRCYGDKSLKILVAVAMAMADDDVFSDFSVLYLGRTKKRLVLKMTCWSQEGGGAKTKKGSNTDMDTYMQRKKDLYVGG